MWMFMAHRLTSGLGERKLSKERKFFAEIQLLFTEEQQKQSDWGYRWTWDVKDLTLQTPSSPAVRTKVWQLSNYFTCFFGGKVGPPALVAVCMQMAQLSWVQVPDEQVMPPLGTICTMQLGWQLERIENLSLDIDWLVYSNLVVIHQNFPRFKWMYLFCFHFTPFPFSNHTSLTFWWTWSSFTRPFTKFTHQFAHPGMNWCFGH